MLLTDIKIGLLNPLREIYREPQIPSQFVWNIGKAISTSAHSFATQMLLMLKKFIILAKNVLTAVEQWAVTIIFVLHILNVIYLNL